MYSIGQLAKAFKISRTTLLYYDSVGLLCPAVRTAANYRRYDEAGYQRLNQIMIFRGMGVSLEEIKNLLMEETQTGVTAMLLKQLGELNLEIQELRDRQERILLFLQKTQVLFQSFARKNALEMAELYPQAGINEKTARKWHQDFEKASPQEHQKFLELLGFGAAEQAEIIQRSRR